MKLPARPQNRSLVRMMMRTPKLVVVVVGLCGLARARAAAAETKSPFAPVHLESGSFNASALPEARWVAGRCSQGAYVDYYVDVDDSHSLHNFFIEVVHSPPKTQRTTRTDALRLLVFEEDIPTDRWTELYADETADRALSFAINANDIKKGRYYFSVQCSPIADAEYAVFFEFIAASLGNGAGAEGHICRDELLYHLFDASPMYNESGELGRTDHLRFRVCVPPESEGSLQLIARVGAPPLRVTQPVVTLDHHGEAGGESSGACRDFSVCEDQLEDGLIWLGVSSIGPCTAYNASAVAFSKDDAECVDELGDAWQNKGAVSLALEHIEYGSCDPNSWVDYRVDLTPEDRQSNLVFEVRDISDGSLNLESINVFLFANEIPQSRYSENRAETSVSDLYAVFKTFVNMRETSDLDRLYLSVQCQETPVSFRVLGEHVAAKLTNKHKTRGEICPGVFIYHYVDMPGYCANDSHKAASSSSGAHRRLAASSSSSSSEEGDDDNNSCDAVSDEFVNATRLRLDVVVHSYEGDVVYAVLVDDPPIRISPPYAEVYAETANDDGLADDEPTRRRLASSLFLQHSLYNDSSAADFFANSSADADVVVPCVEIARYYVGVKTISESCAVYDIEPFITVQDDQADGDDCDIARQDAYENTIDVTELQLQVQHTHSCVAGQYQLFSFEITPDNAHDNLVVQCERLDEPRGGDTPDALTLMLYKPPSIPDDYATEFYDDHGTSGIWSVSVSSHDMTNGTYHLAVKCADISDVQFSLVPIVVKAPLSVGHRSHGEICPQNWVYHSLSINEDDADHRRRRRQLASGSSGESATANASYLVSIWRYSGDFYTLTRHLHPPVKLVPPYAYVDQTHQQFDMYMCNLEVGETHFVGILGGHGCSVYDVQIYPLAPGTACHELEHFGESDPTLAAEEIRFEHYTYGSVSQGASKSFFIRVDEEHDHDNVIFEVEDVTDTSNPTSLVIRVFQDEISEDRESEWRSESSDDGVFSVAISSQDMHSGVWFLTVEGVAPQKVRFKVLPVPVTTTLSLDHSRHGEMYPNEWMIHELSHSDSKSFRVRIVKYDGDVYVMHRRSQAPTLFSPPYFYLDVDTHYVDVDVCDTKDGVYDYIGLYGGPSGLAVYDVAIHEIAPSACVDARDLTLEYESDSYKQLRAGHQELASCESYHYVDFALVMTDELYGENLIFEVISSDAETNPNVLEVYLYDQGNIADDRETEFFSTHATDGAYTISVSSLRTGRGVAPDVFYVAVRCVSQPARFSAVVSIIPGSIEVGTSVFATICPSDWIYFKTVPAQEYNHYDARVNITKYQGALSFLVREDVPPVRLVYPYGTLATDERENFLHLCNIESDVDLFIGVQGGSACASFFVSIEFFQSANCSEEVNAAAVDDSSGESSSSQADGSTVVDLPLHQFRYASCKAESWSTSVLKLSICPGVNILLEVEQLLSSRVDPRATALHAYYPVTSGHRDLEEDAFASSDYATDNVHALTFNYISLIYEVPKIEATNRREIEFAVKCGAADARFRAVVHRIPAELPEGHRQSGEVCSNSWIYHFYNMDQDAHDSYDCVEDDSHGSTTSNASLAASHSSNSSSSSTSSQPHLRFTIRVFRGSFYTVAARARYPPSFNSRMHHLAELLVDELEEADGRIVTTTVDVCDAPEGEKIYLGLFNTEGCSIYEVVASRFAGECLGTGIGY